MVFMNIKTADDGTLSVDGLPFALKPNAKSPTTYRLYNRDMHAGNAQRIRTDQGPDDWRLVLPHEEQRWFSGSGELFQYVADRWAD